MWRAVIVTAFEDCANLSSIKVDAYRKDEAHKWLIKRDEDFEQVCYYAEIDPELVGGRYRRLLDTQEVHFTKIQRLWLEYRECYKTYRVEGNRDQRHRIMARINSIKEMITKLKKKPR